MKIRIKKTVLMEHLNYVIKGISTKNLIPILNCIKLDINNNGITLTSTNNDISIKTIILKKEIEEIVETGEIVVYGRLFYEYIKKLPEGIIDLEELIENKLRIHSNNSTSDINCNDKNDFPKLNFEEKKETIILNGDLLKTLINKVGYASSQTEERPNLTGINLRINGTKLTCSATDSYRVATKTITLPTEHEEAINIIIPTKNLFELNKVLENNIEDVEIHIFNNNILFKSGNISFLSRLINGSFPEVNNLIPSTSEIKLKLKLNELYEALERTALLAREESKQTVKLKLKKDQLFLTSLIPEIGKVEEIIKLEEKNNEEIEISFSARYMMDAIRALNTDEIIIGLNTPTSPILIKSESEKNFIQLFQPIRTY